MKEITQMDLEKSLTEQLNNDVRSLKSEISSLKGTINDKDLEISELKQALVDAKKKYKIRGALSKIKEDYIKHQDFIKYNDEYDCEYIDVDDLEEFLLLFIEKYESI